MAEQQVICDHAKECRKLCGAGYPHKSRGRSCDASYCKNLDAITQCVPVPQTPEPVHIKTIAEIQTEFEKWADARIGDYRDMPTFSDIQKEAMIAKINVLEAARIMLRIIIG